MILMCDSSHFLPQSWACTVKYVLQYRQERNFAYVQRAWQNKYSDFILTRQRDGNLVWDVTVLSKPSLLPISDQNFVTAYVKLLERFACNRLVSRAKRPPFVDRRRLTDDPHLRQEVATVTGDQRGVVHPRGSGIEDEETAFVT